MSGNRLGPKGSFIYFTDDITIGYIIPRDLDLVFAGLGAGASAPVAFDPASPPAGVSLSPAPKRFKPRVVFAQSEADGARKELICFHPTSDLYLATSRQDLPDIDGEDTFVTTGKRGETQSY